MKGKSPLPNWPVDSRSILARFMPEKGPSWKELQSYLPTTTSINAWRANAPCWRQPGLGVLPSSTHQRRRLGVDGPDGPPVSKDTLLRFQQDEGRAVGRRLPGEPKDGSKADAFDGPRGHLSASQHQQAGTGTPGLSLPAEGVEVNRVDQAWASWRSRTLRLSPTQLRVQRIPHPVAEEVEGQHHHRDRQAREE